MELTKQQLREKINAQESLLIEIAGMITLKKNFENRQSQKSMFSKTKDELRKNLNLLNDKRTSNRLAYLFQ